MGEWFRRGSIPKEQGARVKGQDTPCLSRPVLKLGQAALGEREEI